MFSRNIQCFMLTAIWTCPGNYFYKINPHKNCIYCLTNPQLMQLIPNLSCSNFKIAPSLWSRHGGFLMLLMTGRLYFGFCILVYTLFTPQATSGSCQLYYWQPSSTLATVWLGYLPQWVPCFCEKKKHGDKNVVTWVQKRITGPKLLNQWGLEPEY